MKSTPSLIVISACKACRMISMGLEHFSLPVTAPILDVQFLMKQVVVGDRGAGTCRKLTVGCCSWSRTDDITTCSNIQRKSNMPMSSGAGGCYVFHYFKFPHVYQHMGILVGSSVSPVRLTLLWDLDCQQGNILRGTGTY